MDRSEWDRQNAHRRLDGEPEFPWDPDASDEDRTALMFPPQRKAKVAVDTAGADRAVKDAQAQVDEHSKPRTGARKDS